MPMLHNLDAVFIDDTQQKIDLIIYSDYATCVKWYIYDMSVYLEMLLYVLVINILLIKMYGKKVVAFALVPATYIIFRIFEFWLWHGTTSYLYILPIFTITLILMYVKWRV